MPKHRVPSLIRGRNHVVYHHDISIDKLARLIGTPNCPALIDVRTDEDFAADPRLIPGAVRRSHRRCRRLGGEFSGQLRHRRLPERAQSSAQGTAAWLRHAGCRPKRSKAASRAGKRPACRWCRPRNCRRATRKGRTVWVTRARPKIDRIACPWLIRRFVDPNAVFLFVAPAEVVGRRRALRRRRPSTSRACSGAIAASSAPSTPWSRSSGLRPKPLLRLATIVRGADTGAARPRAGGAGPARRLARPVAHVSPTISRSSRPA